MNRARALLPLALALLWSTPALAHDVKDPVCRMMVDSDTARFKQKLGNKTFYFCSKRCQTSFAHHPSRYEKLAEELERQDLHDYTVELKAPPALAGKPTPLALTIRYADSKKLVTQFELVHERLLHLLMVSEDSSWFEHQHPVRGKDGVFRLSWTFPRPGRYRLYADFTPADGDNQVKPLALSVGGGRATSRPLRPDRVRVKQVGDLRFQLQLRPGALRMEKPTFLTYVVTDRRGRPVRDIQPFIGAMGHLIAISQDGEQLVHTHVLQSATHAAKENEPVVVTPAMVTQSGPAFTFKLTLPSGGLYTTWAQFMHHNRVYTAPFTFQVEELWGKPSSTARAKATRRGGVQRATIVVDGGYSPATISVQAGRPVELTFLRKEEAGCGDVVEFPTLGLKRALAANRKTVVTFTPNKAGAVPFTCRMSMYRGQVVVR